MSDYSLASGYKNPVLAQVIVDAGHQLGDRLFSYVVPAHLAPSVKVGSQVMVPFGRMKPRSACVVTVDTKYGTQVAPEKLKEILDVVGSQQLFDKEYFEFLQAVANYYMAPTATVIAAALPPKPAMKAKQTKTVVWEGAVTHTVKQENIVEVLKSAGGKMLLSELLQAAGTTRGTIMRMEKDGIIRVVEQAVVRDPLIQYGLATSDTKEQTIAPPTLTPVVTNDQLPVLTPDQKKAYSVLDEELCRVLNSGVNADLNRGTDLQPWLIHGVTGSGKTEIYLRLIARTLSLGRSALLMVPEIALTEQLAHRLQERFGELVSVWHSGLSAGERYDTWCRLKNRQVRVLLGARSSVLADMPGLGLIVLDEEHDGSYKQSSPAPRYNARDVALEKARRCGAMVVMGSATPDLVSLQTARMHNRILQLPKRVTEQPMPEVKIVDMRVEFQQGQHGDFSRALKTEIAACLDRKEQAILLVNRRGFAHYVFCKTCGFVVKCRHCSVSLVLHQNAGHSSYLECHHCGYRKAFTPACPSCGEHYLEACGLGTQKVEQELSKLFPAARVLRLDGDVASKRGAYQEILRQFANGEADILTGTQMVAKGLDIPKVTLVGVLAADTAFNLPDYRSCERGFQLLTQVAGRAGRGFAPGKVILQTYDTDLPALRLAQKHDYETFASTELLSRQEMEYPPYSQLIRIVVSGAELIEVQAFCEQLAEDLSKFLDGEGESRIKILGPAPCLLERVKGSHRYHLLVKNLIGESGRKIIVSFLQTCRAGRTLNMAVDVDAVDLL